MNYLESLHGEMITFCNKKKLQVGKYYAMVQYRRISHHNIGYTTCYSHVPHEYVGWYKETRSSSVHGKYIVFEENGTERVIHSGLCSGSISFIEAEPQPIRSYVLK
jgi:hypothetical protein